MKSTQNRFWLLFTLLIGMDIDTALFAGGGMPWVLPGNNVGFTDFLGTTNAQPLQLRTTLAQPILFQTNSVERMRITPAGFVGIGITVPNRMLTIIGGGINSGIRIQDGSIGGNLSLWSDGTGQTHTLYGLNGRI